MEIEVKLYGVLRRHRPADKAGAPHHPFVFTCEPGETAQSVLLRLGIDDHQVAAAAINQQNVSLDTPLQPGDHLAFFPPSAGGTALFTIED